jgi:hypothetical protein
LETCRINGVDGIVVDVLVEVTVAAAKPQGYR